MFLPVIITACRDPWEMGVAEGGSQALFMFTNDGFTGPRVGLSPRTPRVRLVESRILGAGAANKLVYRERLRACGNASSRPRYFDCPATYHLNRR